MTSFGFILFQCVCVQCITARNIDQCCACGSFHKLLPTPLQTKNMQVSAFQNIIINIEKVILLIGFKKYSLNYLVYITTAVHPSVKVEL